VQKSVWRVGAHGSTAEVDAAASFGSGQQGHRDQRSRSDNDSWETPRWGPTGCYEGKPIARELSPSPMRPARHKLFARQAINPSRDLLLPLI
jgi:hypothetical protein